MSKLRGRDSKGKALLHRSTFGHTYRYLRDSPKYQFAYFRKSVCYNSSSVISSSVLLGAVAFFPFALTGVALFLVVAAAFFPVVALALMRVIFFLGVVLFVVASALARVVFFLGVAVIFFVVARIIFILDVIFFLVVAFALAGVVFFLDAAVALFSRVALGFASRSLLFPLFPFTAASPPTSSCALSSRSSSRVLFSSDLAHHSEVSRRLSRSRSFVSPVPSSRTSDTPPRAAGALAERDAKSWSSAWRKLASSGVSRSISPLRQMFCWLMKLSSSSSIRSSHPGPKYS
mmetsp:Transcript_11022/g.24301  ORF Transcript_11022/g.24301 Transcript_11022/m.24301 type:complete len:289 (-) Transcript_11022:813-1679(-)